MSRTKNKNNKSLAKDKVILLGGRIDEAFTRFLPLVFKAVKAGHPDFQVKADANRLYKMFRLKHHPTPSGQHIIGYITYSPANNETYLCRDDGRRIKHEVLNVHGRTWYKFPCLQCDAFVTINGEGTPAILGVLEISNENGEYYPCKNLAGCAII